jgi:hypothetical protein
MKIPLSVYRIRFAFVFWFDLTWIYFFKKPVEPKPAAAADDDIDLFGSDDEEQNEETKKRLAAYAAKKSTSKSFSSDWFNVLWIFFL